MTTDVKVKEQILSLLMNDSRLSFRTIAKRLNISTTTVSRIVKQLEDSGVIQGYSTLIDWSKFGYDSALCLQISVTPQADIDSMGSAIRDITAVKQVFYTTGDATFSAYAVCKDAAEATEVLEKLRHLDGIFRVVPHTVLKVY